MHFHQKIHQYLMEYRNKHDRSFNFIVRQRSFKNDKKFPGGKFAHGLVFQGNNDYCFVGLIDRSGGANATRSVGLVFKPIENGFNVILEIVFPGEKDEALVNFYRKLASRFEDIRWDPKNTRAYKTIGEFNDDDPSFIYNWLDINYPIIQQTSKDSGILDLIPSNAKFDKLQTELQQKIEKATKEVNYWIFQGSPKIYNIVKALKAGHLKSWKITAHRDRIKIGDQVIIWQTGSQAGCHALAEVTSNVSIFKDEEFERQYYTSPDEDSATDRVKIKIVKYLVDSPILWEDIKVNPAFSNFKAGNRGTNFSTTKEEYNAILKLSLNNSNSDKIREEFSDWLKGSETSNKINSYFRAIDILNEILNKDLYLEKNIATLSLLYQDTLENQRDENSKYYYAVAPSYGNSGFYSASIKAFINFLKEGHGNIDKKDSPIKTNKMTINQILYGPPGTGKTFYLKNQLFDKYTSKQTSITKEQHFETVVNGCSWWQVIAIALLDLGNSKVSDIFEHDWVQKKASLSNSKTVRPTLWGQLQSHTIETCEYVNVSKRQQPLIFNKTKDSYWEILEEEVKELTPELYDLKDSVDNYNPDPDKVVKHYDFVTFHQSFAYEDFIEGIKPILPEHDEETTDLGYAIEDGVFKNLCKRAKNDPENRYAIFIDEINRGNVSAIFGELITLIEVDKREGAKNKIKIKLPYSKQEFSVPSNLDIYGTMNTADRSVEALDTALRRRFEFKEMMPEYSVIESETVNEIQLSKVLESINQRIELLIDRDHTIGHSYFVNVNTEEKLANAFNNKIIPLLQEYFYGDYGKIGLVLGKGFVKNAKNKDLKFSSFKYEGKDEFIIPSFILKPIDESNIIDAVNQLFETKES